MSIRTRLRTIKQRCQDWLDRTVNLPPEPVSVKTVLYRTQIDMLVQDGDEKVVIPSAPGQFFQVEMEMKSVNPDALKLICGAPLRPSQIDPDFADSFTILGTAKPRPFDWKNVSELAS